MAKRPSGIDKLFVKAEQLAIDDALFGKRGEHDVSSKVKGLLKNKEIDKICKELEKSDVDEYISRTVNPSEDKNRIGAKVLIKSIASRILQEFEFGPLYAVEVIIQNGETSRRIAILAQERTSANGVWMPEHHKKAVEIIREFAHYSIPIVTLIDTPGADAGEEANKENQAHSISHLITEMSNIDLPTIGIILGNGYSGGAIPLATTNLLFSVTDGVFNTIQPKGLASIARKYDLSWQECAKYVGVSSYELYQQGYLDGIIDYAPNKKMTNVENLIDAILTGLDLVEKKSESFVRENEYVVDHYVRSIERYLNPSEELQEYQKHSELSLAEQPTGHLNIFGISFRYLRYLGLRNRIHSTTTTKWSRSVVKKQLQGDLSERRQKELEMAFQNWVENPIEIRYDDNLLRTKKSFSSKKSQEHEQRGTIAKLIFGDPKTNSELAQAEMELVYGFHLYNLWKDAAQNNFGALIKFLNDKKNKPSGNENQTVLDVLLEEGIRKNFIVECRNFIIFDLVYDQIIFDLRSIAKEAKAYNIISMESVQKLIESSIQSAISKIPDLMEDSKKAESVLKEEFYSWVKHFISDSRRGEYLKSVEEWKKIAHPRISEPLFAILTFLFDHLLIEYFESERSGKEYDGRVNIRNIGMKDFWNRLSMAYQDLLIQDILVNDKKIRKTPQMIIDKFFTDFKELNGELISSDPANFPGFRPSIEAALDKGVAPCGIITGLARFKMKNLKRRVGVVVSNLNFQAGAFDMASSEKFCRLLVECAKLKSPVVCFISSSGMQTKEGAGSLFSMAIVNDRITRFVRDNHLPVICFGFGDCTGGAQASFVTHPLVQTYYFSGTNMPFAGQIVVPAYLSSMSTLSNYLSIDENAMKGLVVHPFNEKMDADLSEIDAAMPVAKETVEDVCARVIKGALSQDLEDEVEEENYDEAALFKPVRKVLIHARGCTAVKLIRIAQQENISVVLVQSDVDMDSVAADMLTENDRLVCIGGNTPDESYLNAKSIIRIASHEEVDSLHPGIGFLSENSAFASLCRNHVVNFIGPSVNTMEVMGNKSNAINTARRCKVPVVPGSHGITENVEQALTIAQEIKFPVIIKAVHGGGGKGIQVVEREEDFNALYSQISAEAKSAFGSGDLYLEKYVTNLRHVEVQLLRDRFGHTLILGLRDCSVQRNNQKIVEESLSTALSKELEEQVYKYTDLISNEVDYVGAGTVEFIFNLDENAIYFMEMNTRLQVEHPVTEKVSGVDIVAAQFAVASGESIENINIGNNGYAVEVRITAERFEVSNEGEIKFVPNPGEITECVMPENDKIDIISMIEKGKQITPYYDSLIMQVIAHGPDRDTALNTMDDYLSKVKITGVPTNILLVREILKDEVFRNGEYNTSFLNGFLERIDIQDVIKRSEADAGVQNSLLSLDALKIDGSDEIKVLSPSTGIFYRTPSPEEPEFVTEGKVVNNKDTLCLLEAMKLFTSVSIDSFNKGQKLYDNKAGYEVVKIIPANAQAVNKGDLLYVIKPV